MDNFLLIRIIIIVALTITIYRYWESYAYAIRSKYWPKVLATVISSSKHFEFDSYYPNIVYKYQVHGMNYEGNVYSILGSPTLGSERYSSRVSQKFIPGTEIEVYYDPIFPERSTITAGLSWHQIIDLSIFFLVLVYGFFYREINTFLY